MPYSPGANDIRITCIDCNKPFYFSEREQEFYQNNGYTNPKRCFSCRKKKKAMREQSENGNTV